MTPSDIIAICAIIVSVLVAAFGALLITLYKNDKAETHRQTNALISEISLLKAGTEKARDDRDELRNRLHADELATEKLAGRVDLVQNNHDKLVDDVEEIKRTMVTRDLFDASVKNLQAQLALILAQIGRYPSNPRGMPATTPTSEMPPRQR